MKKEELVDQIKKKGSFLCIGLDVDLKKIPKFLLDSEDPVFEFNKRIIDATKDLCVAYKPNIAFYECLGEAGWTSLRKTIDYIPKEIFTIADAKRGDIGNTATKYAETFFATYDFDSVTVAPYMGKDSVSPFLDFSNKWAIVLGLTSNQGAFDFQYLNIEGKPLHLEVIEQAASWGTDQNLMFVVGATKAQQLSKIREIIPHHFLLVPGVGAQGGSLEEVCKFGLNDEVGLLVNSSRGIIYAGDQEDFDQKARQAALDMQQQMQRYV